VKGRRRINKGFPYILRNSLDVESHIEARGRAVDEITDNQRRYYRFTLRDVPKWPRGGRVLVMLEYR
jgi:hypothetical protein